MGCQAPGSPAVGQITVPAKTESIAAVTAFVDGELEKLNCPVRQQMQIDVAIDELISNVARYAYAPGTGEVTVLFGYDETSRTAALTFIDRGIPYDPLKKPDPNVALPAREREIGGLGIFLVKKTMDEVSYRYEDGKNILCVKKKLAGTA